jgi:MYXO-CTERM domain-containing protein
MSFKDPAVDAALETLMTSCDKDELVEAAWIAQEKVIEQVGYLPLYYRSMNEGHRNDTFEGWFTQLGGIAGTETPRHCLLYLKPITEKPAQTPTTTEAPSGGDGGTCLGTILLVGMLAAGAAVALRRRS